MKKINKQTKLDGNYVIRKGMMFIISQTENKYGKSTQIRFLKIRLEWCGCAKSNCIDLKIMCKKIIKKYKKKFELLKVENKIRGRWQQERKG